MRRGALILTTALAACGPNALEVCAPFGGDTCLVVRARGRDPVDQLEVTALSGFVLAPNPGLTPSVAGAPFELPALVPIDLGNFGGEFRLRVAGLREGAVRSLGGVEEVIKRGERMLVEVQLVRLDGDGGPPDLAVELPDLATDDGAPVECSVDCGVLPGVDPAKVRCLGASCAVTNACLEGRGHCSTAWQDGCEADFTNAGTCGSCTNNCGGSTPLCENGSCVSSCGAGTPILCGSGCVSLNDPQTCGGCDMRCEAPLGAVATCDGGQCGFTCPGGSRRAGSQCVQWELQQSGTTDSLYSIFGASDTQVWVGGELGTLLDLQTNGTWRARSLIGAGDITGIWVSEGSEIWMSGSDGKVYRSTDNNVFTPTTVSTGGLWSIAGNYGLGNQGPWTVSFSRIYAWKDNAWSMELDDPKAGLLAVWSGSQAFAVGSIEKYLNPVIFRYGVLYRGPGNWVGEQPTPRNLLGVWGTSDSDFYVVGRIGTIVHWKNSQWTVEKYDGVDLHAVGGTGSNVYAVGDEGAIFHSTGNGAWTPQVSGTNMQLRAIWGINGHVWAVGEGGVILKKL